MTYCNPRTLAAAITLAAATMAPLAVAQTPAGSVSGKLINESGEPLAGVVANYRRTPKVIGDSHFHLHPVPGDPVVRGSVTTHADGTFSIVYLPPGDYSLCLDTPPDLYVDPCRWNSSSGKFSITQGGSVALKPITIISGVRIHFLMTDPQGLLPTGRPMGVVASVGVLTAGGLYRPAIVKSRSGSVIEAVITVPHDQRASPWVFSRTLKFTDSSNAPFKMAPISPAVGATDHNLSFTVSR